MKQRFHVERRINPMNEFYGKLIISIEAIRDLWPRESECRSLEGVTLGSETLHLEWRSQTSFENEQSIIPWGDIPRKTGLSLPSPYSVGINNDIESVVVLFNDSSESEFLKPRLANGQLHLIGTLTSYGFREASHD